ncbi:MAG: hypothetical protein NQU45_07970 [Methanothermobacter sp.]|nr:hypothetical protein [Methanothermobacter sp.]
MTWGHARQYHHQISSSTPYGVVRDETLLAEEAFQNSYGNRVFFKTDEHRQHWEQETEAINNPIILINYTHSLN